MEKVYKSLINSVEHLKILDEIFSVPDNYSDKKDYQLYAENLEKFSEIDKEINFSQELYSQYGRQMKLADVIEYIFFSRGIFSVINDRNQLIEENIPKFLELVLRFTNLLMLYEITTTDQKIRKAFLLKIKKNIKEVGDEKDFDKLLNWDKWVGLTEKETPKGAPSEYFDSILPKTAGGLWHEMLVYAFILRYDIGYIFPLLLHQKIVSLNKKLSPPDLIILRKDTKRYFGIEIGNLKERQSGGFMVPSGIPVVPLDTMNCRISDRCPTCKKWIGICPKVIKDFSDPKHKINRTEVRCLYDCDRYTLAEKIDGKCPYIKYFNGLHHHYNCVGEKEKKKIIADIIAKHKVKETELADVLKNKNLPSDTEIRSKKINYLKTHYLWYQELSGFIENS